MSAAENPQPGDCVHGNRYHCPACGGVPVPAPSVEVAAVGPACANCEKTIDGEAWCGKCHDHDVEESEQEAFDEAASDALDNLAKPARDWFARRKLLFPSEITPEVEAAFELFIRDAEDGQC